MGQSIVGTKCKAHAKSSFRRAVRMGMVTVSASAMMLVAVAGSPSTARAADTGQSLFKANCAVCHGNDGHGSATGKALKAPDLHSQAVQKLTKAQIEKQIEDGKGNMPPFKATLNHAQIEKLVAYVRTFGKK